MSVEIEGIIHQFELQQSLLEELKIWQLQQILETQTRLANHIYEKFWNSLTGRDETISEIMRLLRIHHAFAHQYEKVTSELEAANLGFETLTQDTHRGKSTADFIETKKPLATGVPTNGIAVAIIANDVGMAASYKNAITDKNFQRAIEANIDNPNDFCLGDDTKLLASYMTPDDLTDSAKAATVEALGDFIKILPQGYLPTNGVEVYAAGLKDIRPSLIPVVLDTITSTLRYGELAVNYYRHLLGQPLGIIYGGITSDKYSSPKFYNLKDFPAS